MGFLKGTLITLVCLIVFFGLIHIVARQIELETRITRLERDKYIRDKYNGDINKYKRDIDSNK